MTRRQRFLASVVLAMTISVGWTYQAKGQAIVDQPPLRQPIACETVQCESVLIPASEPRLIIPKPNSGTSTSPVNSASASPEVAVMKEYLYAHAGVHAPVLDRLIQCESGWKPTIKNRISTASGLAQFLNSTWTSTRLRMGKPDPMLLLKHDWKEHIDTTIFLWDEGRGAGHWSESKYCWTR